MKGYIKNLYEQAKTGIELAGDNFNVEINIDCRNIIKILDELEKLKQQQEKINQHKKY